MRNIIYLRFRISKNLLLEKGYINQYLFNIFKKAIKVLIEKILYSYNVCYDASENKEVKTNVQKH